MAREAVAVDEIAGGGGVVGGVGVWGGDDEVGEDGEEDGVGEGELGGGGGRSVQVGGFACGLVEGGGDSHDSCWFCFKGDVVVRCGHDSIVDGERNARLLNVVDLL